MFPSLTDTRASDIAQAMVEGFDRHYRLFREASAGAKARFEAADWAGQQQAQADRIAFYDVRVDEAVERLKAEFHVDALTADVWQQVKLHYIGLLTNHHQPELAETFFNSVTTRLLDRAYFNNEFLFVRPAISTEYLEIDTSVGVSPTYRAWYPTHASMHQTLVALVRHFGLKREFLDLDRDIERVLQALEAAVGFPLASWRLRPNFQIQTLESLFYRNKGAYLVGKVINGFRELPLCLPILHDEASGKLVIDTALFDEDDMLMVFSFARAYFMVDMGVPSAYVQFLRSIMPRKPRSEIYNALGLQKQGKNMFYRDFLNHQRHSSDRFRIAPGIKGMVMLVFDQPSFPYVFKVIKDFFPPPKETTREQVKGKYLLVKRHDRVGRMADTLEYSNVAFPLHRFETALVEELQRYCPSQVTIDGDLLVVSHVYIERRMIPLNIYLQDAQTSANVRAIEHAVVEYGNALKDLIAGNIFPGDMLWKNFGVTRGGKVVFYDYDEIEYITDCNFRRVPKPRNEEDEMSGEVWYSVGKHDVFPETFGPFLLGHPTVREVFMAHHADLLDPEFWQLHKDRIAAGHVHDVFPYETSRRFANVALPRVTPVAAPAAPSVEDLESDEDNTAIDVDGEPAVTTLAPPSDHDADRAARSEFAGLG